jgi:hypothetical protein
MPGRERNPVRPAARLSSSTLVERRIRAALRALRMAMSSLPGWVPSMIWNRRRPPAGFTTATAMVACRARADAMAASASCRAPSSERALVVWMGSIGGIYFTCRKVKPRTASDMVEALTLYLRASALMRAPFL